MSTHPNTAVPKALKLLKRIRRLEGTALINSGILLHDDCPRGSDSQGFCRTAVQLGENLEQQGNHPNEVLIGFDGGELLLLFRDPVILGLFFERGEDLKAIEAGGAQFLNQFSSALGIQPNRPTVSTQAVTPTNEVTQNAAKTLGDEDAWNEYRELLVVLFSKVLGSAQASRTIDRELASMGVKGDVYLRKIKDKKVRKQIELELCEIVDRLVK